ncbi:MAG: M48 family metalloprotease [Rhizobiaceae bacterium]
MRSALRFGAASLLVMALAGCEVLNVAGTTTGTKDDLKVSLAPNNNPVTVDTVNRGDRFAKLAAAQHPKILATYGGEYPDEKLERMVARVVGRLTFNSNDPGQTYRVTILNSPSVNAFALPGGYVYVTRGLLALANDSAELAAVISHEMAHVTARHGQQRQQLEADAGLAARVVSEVLQDNEAGRQAAIRGKLRLAQFTRNQELEADAIGIKATGAEAFDPYAAGRFLNAMGAYTSYRTAATNDDMSLDFLASHPSTPQRVELANRHARLIGPPGTGDRDRDAYLAGIDGMLFGDSPEEGYVRGTNFLHPVLGITFSVPAGFDTENNKDAVLSAGPGEIAVRFDAVELPGAASLSDYIKSGWVAGLDEASVRPAIVGGNEAVTARAQAEKWQFNITVLRLNGKVFRFLIAAPIGSPTLDSVAASVTQSFRLLTPEERASVKPARLQIVTVKAGETAGALANRMSGVDRKLDLFRILNGLTAGQSVSAGDKVKLVVTE